MKDLTITAIRREVEGRFPDLETVYAFADFWKRYKNELKIQARFIQINAEDKIENFLKMFELCEMRQKNGTRKDQLIAQQQLANKKSEEQKILNRIKPQI
jgi:hypothetical protein